MVFRIKKNRSVTTINGSYKGLAKHDFDRECHATYEEMLSIGLTRRQCRLLYLKSVVTYLEHAQPFKHKLTLIGRELSIQSDKSLSLKHARAFVYSIINEYTDRGIKHVYPIDPYTVSMVKRSDGKYSTSLYGRTCTGKIIRVHLSTMDGSLGCCYKDDDNHILVNIEGIVEYIYTSFHKVTKPLLKWFVYSVIEHELAHRDLNKRVDDCWYVNNAWSKYLNTQPHLKKSLYGSYGKTKKIRDDRSLDAIEMWCDRAGLIGAVKRMKGK